MKKIQWDIRREGRSWKGPEAMERYDLTPEKMEMVEGKIFRNDEERMAMLGLLLENTGIDEALRLGDIRLWREAIEAFDSGE